MNRLLEIANTVDRAVYIQGLEGLNLSFERSVNYDDEGMAKSVTDIVEFREELIEMISEIETQIKNETQDNNWDLVSSMAKLAKLIDSKLSVIEGMLEE